MSAERLISSLSGRLLVAAAAFLVVALIAAGIVIDGLLHRFVTRQIDRRLDAQLLALAAAVTVDPEGLPRLKRDLDLPPYDRALSGWYWQVESDGGVLTSRSLGADPLPTERSGVETQGPAGEPLRLRRRSVILPDEAGTVMLAAAAPRAEIDAPLSSARRALTLALAALGLALSAAMALQVRLGLTPLRRLAQELKSVRAGDRAGLPTRQPLEVADLVSEVNALLVQNRQQLERARAHVANLAHGLRTPLAILAARVADDGSTAAAESRHLIDVMDRRIAHHLRRARIAALGVGGATMPTQVGPRIVDLVSAMTRIHVERKIAVATDIPPGIAVRCDQEDVDEMLGNLVDNAFKWARSTVVVAAWRAGAMIEIRIADDGSGLAAADIDRALGRGERLDETTPGTGFGLPISRELAALYGGTLDLAPSELGGLAATLSLPG